MIFDSHKKMEWPLIFFAALALAITSIVGYIILVAVEKTPEGAITELAPVGPSAEELVRGYETSISNLRQSVEKHSGSSEELLAVTENALLTFRVPKEFLDAHIAAVLQIRQIHAQPLPDKEKLRSSVQMIIASLETAAHSL